MPVVLGLAVVAAFLLLSYRHKLATSGLAGMTSEMSPLTTYLVGALVNREQMLDRHCPDGRERAPLGTKGRARRLIEADRTGRDFDLHQVSAAHGGRSAGPAESGVRAL